MDRSGILFILERSDRVSATEEMFTSGVRPLREWIDVIFDDIRPGMRVLFRTDAGRISGLSFGHVSRCMILARTLRNTCRSEVLFLMRGYDEGTAFAGESGWDVKAMPVEMTALEEREIVMQTAAEFRPDWLVVDLPYRDLDLSCFTSLRREGVKVLFIDDARFATPDVDVVLNSNLSAPGRTGRPKESTTRYLLGPDYFILDESQIAEAQTDVGGLGISDRNSYGSRGAPVDHENTGPAGNPKSQPVTHDSQHGSLCNVLITFGGSDPADLTRKVFEAVRKRKWDGVLFSIILGPGYPDAERTATLLEKGRNIHVFVNPPGILPMLQACDLAICAGGRTLYELLCLRKRFLPIASAPHEAEVVEEALRQGLITTGLTEWNEDRFFSALDLLISSPAPQPEPATRRYGDTR